MFTTDLSTDVGKVRLLLQDLDPSKPVFPSDDMIQSFLDLELGDVKQAAALGLETIAGNRALVLQVMQILDLKTDGQKTAQGLLAVAERLRETSNLDWAGFDIAQVVDDSDFDYREFMLKAIIKNLY